ncbi:hypothetical protein BpHYR1_018473 [Brachionus plicatilis]|uniref:Uncharacterized protein n=1 Tax=Brachionus plicatilis TaxID=10195 RepID=A0A3M7Q224_BRAPC|nr:hypothetical protein BpHYR1_018473 [Brachionus plicatilis]
MYNNFHFAQDLYKSQEKKSEQVKNKSNLDLLKKFENNKYKKIYDLKNILPNKQEENDPKKQYLESADDNTFRSETTISTEDYAEKSTNPERKS